MTLDPQKIFEVYQKDPGHDMYPYLQFLKAVGTGTVLEIGVRSGVSTSAFLLSEATRVISIDIDPACSELYEGHWKWNFIEADSRDIDKVYGELHDQHRCAKVDVLFVDGLHTYDCLYSDLCHYAPLVRKGGLILVHDVAPHHEPTPEETEAGWPGNYTTKAWNDYMGVMDLWEQSRVLPGEFGLGVTRLPGLENSIFDAIAETPSERIARHLGIDNIKDFHGDPK